MLRALIGTAASTEPAVKFSTDFLLTEFSETVDAYQLDSWEAYRDVKRMGRKTRLSEPQRAALWAIFAAVRVALDAAGTITRAGLFARLAHIIGERAHPPFDHVVVDEAQDISPIQLRFLAAIGVHLSNGLFFAGDLGQRIFQQPFSWNALGVDIRGRARTLQINYRTSHQIRQQADRLLGRSVSDADGNEEERRGAISVFNGALPQMIAFASSADEIAAVAAWLRARRSDGVVMQEMGVFVRSVDELDRARAAISLAGFDYTVLDENVEAAIGRVAISTMHHAKGLEFRAVVVMACDDEIIPSQQRIAAVTDDADLDDVYNTERHLLYVACTRARDYLLTTSVHPRSEFLDDMARA